MASPFLVVPLGISRMGSVAFSNSLGLLMVSLPKIRAILETPKNRAFMLLQGRPRTRPLIYGNSHTLMQFVEGSALSLPNINPKFL